MRLIDADSISLKDIPMDMGGLVYIEDVLLKIEELPTVDTVPTESEFKRIAIQRGYVPVVRCGECTHRRQPDGFCPVIGGFCGDENWFCACGIKEER